MEWTPDAVALLTEMWKGGYSAREIAHKIGPKVSRNAVIGKANRLGLSSQRPPAARRIAPVEPVHLGTTRSCQWPHGDPRKEDFYFCGAKVIPGKSYCLEHWQIAYRRPDAEINAAKSPNGSENRTQSENTPQSEKTASSGNPA